MPRWGSLVILAPTRTDGHGKLDEDEKDKIDKIDKEFKTSSAKTIPSRRSAAPTSAVAC